VSEGAGHLGSRATQSGHRRTTQWNLASNYAIIATSLISGIVLVPLYLRHISVETYGLWLATGNVLAWVTAIDPGLSNVLQQRVGVAYGQKDAKHVGLLTGAGVVLAASLAILVLVVGELVAGHIPELVSAQQARDAHQLTVAFSIAVIGAALSVFGFAIAAINTGLKGSLGVGAVNLLANLAGIVVSIVLVLRDYGVVSIAGGLLTRGIVYVGGHVTYLTVRLVRERVRPNVVAREVRELSALSAATFLGRAGGMLSGRIDLFLIAHLLSPESVTVLSITRKSAEVNAMLVERASVAFMPSVSHLVGEGDIARARAVLHRLVLMVLWLVGLLAAGIFAFNEAFVRLWVGGHLYAGAAVTAAVGVSFMLSVLSNSLSNLVFALGDIRRNSLVTFIQSLVFVALLYGFTRRWGIVGVPLSAATSLALVSIGYYTRAFTMRLRYSKDDVTEMTREVLKAGAIAASVAIVGARWHAESWSVLIAEVCLVTACYVAGLSILSRSFRIQAFGAFNHLSTVLRLTSNNVP
jgi:O-antigen/teichoic acid export membrane protein